MNVSSIIVEEIEAVAREHKKMLPRLHCDTPLMETGLDSLCFATLVARLEDRLRVDPFSTADEAGLPITFGDFVAFYENVVGGAADADSQAAA